MHAKPLLSLCLSLIVTACSGGLLPTPRPSPSPVPPIVTPTLAAPANSANPTATPGEAAATASLAANAPELAAGLLPELDRERYLRLTDALEARDEAAADWLAATGLFLRDGKLDGDELQLLTLLLQTKGDALWYLTHARALQGIDASDVEYLASIVPTPSENWYFNDDIQGLEAFELLSKEGRRSLQRIFEKARHDPEVRKGLYLINMLGSPDPRAFKYPVPGYNVQLYLLARLLEQGVPGDYERAAVAAALTYGSLLSLCEPGVRERIVSYAGERVRFLIEGDVVLAAAGAGWRSTSYPLEALMLVLWAGQASAFPEPGRTPAQAGHLAAAAATQPLKGEDLDRLLVRMSVLREMHDEMMRAAAERASGEARACELVEAWWSMNRREEPDDGGPDLNQQWARFRSGRGFAGGVGSAYVLQGLAASINLPVPWAELWYAEDGHLRVVPFGLRLEPGTRALRLGQSAQRATAGLPGEAKAALVWWRTPWDNWRLHEGVRGCQTLPLPLAVWRAGIPSGYLFRLGVASEEDVRTALGVPPATPVPATES